MHAFWGAQSPFFGIWPCHLFMGQIYGLIERVSSQDLLVDDARARDCCFIMLEENICET